VVPSIVRLLRFASFLICTIVVLSFGAFVIEQTRSASNHQQEQISGHPSAPSARSTISDDAHGGAARTDTRARVGSVRKALDEASAGLTSPFAGVLASSNSEWATRGAKLLLALILYGFGLGYLARVLRVRV
jgi:hypothetical protein